MISDFYKQTAKIERMALSTGSTTKKEWTTIIASQACSVQPQEANKSQDGQGAFGKTSLMICAIADVQEGDRITIGGNVYRSTGVKRYEGYGDMDHLEVEITIFK